MHRCVAFGHGGDNAFCASCAILQRSLLCGSISYEAIARLSEVTDKMHGLLLDPTDALMGCVEGNPEEAELAALADVIERYERYRFHP